MWFGMTLGAIALFPGFHLLAQASNPALVEAARRTPVVVVAVPASCTTKIDVTGKASYISGCDIARNALANAGVSYTRRTAAPGQPAEVDVGAASLAVGEGQGLPAPALKVMTASFTGKLNAALVKAGYPTKSDPAKRNPPLVLAVLLVFTIAATALYGPMAAALTELFPTKVRYTALSFPYHLGTGWIGGFQPVASFTIVVATGNIYAGLWYPVIFTAISVVALIFFLPETRGRSLDA
jgi:hypothetical protein